MCISIMALAPREQGVQVAKGLKRSDRSQEKESHPKGDLGATYGWRGYKANRCVKQTTAVMTGIQFNLQHLRAK